MDDISQKLRQLNKRQGELCKIYKQQIKKLKSQVNYLKERSRFYTSSNPNGEECYWKNYVNVFNWKNTFLSNHRYSAGNRAASSNLLNNFKEESHTSDVSCQCSDSCIPNESDSYGYNSEEEYTVTEEYMELLETSLRHKESLRLEKEKKNLKDMRSNQMTKTRKKMKKRVKKKIKRSVFARGLEKKMRKLKEINFDQMRKTAKEIKRTVKIRIKKDDSERDDIEECQALCKAMVSASRLEEVRQLYGVAAPMILGMETAMQLSFDKYCKNLKPIAWPNLPFNIDF